MSVLTQHKQNTTHFPPYWWQSVLAKNKLEWDNFTYSFSVVNTITLQYFWSCLLDDLVHQTPQFSSALFPNFFSQLYSRFFLLPITCVLGLKYSIKTITSTSQTQSQSRNYRYHDCQVNGYWHLKQKNSWDLHHRHQLWSEHTACAGLHPRREGNQPTGCREWHLKHIVTSGFIIGTV